MHSEEVNKLNVALKYCDQLKNNLQASILHVQMLNRKYNTTDYTLSFSTPISPRNNQSMQQRNRTQLSTKKQPIRSIRDITGDFNRFIVDGIKLRREVETATTQLKLLRNDHKIESPYITKRRMQPANNRSSSPGCRHGRCFKSSSLNLLDSLEKSRVAPIIRSRHSLGAMVMPHQPAQLPRKRTRETVHNQLVINAQAKANTQSPVSVKKIRFQSTPIKINEPSTSNSVVNRSCSLNISAINSTSDGFSQSIVYDDESYYEYTSTMHSSIKPCFRTVSNSNASAKQCDSPKRICWTAIAKVKRYSIYR